MGLITWQHFQKYFIFRRNFDIHYFISLTVSPEVLPPPDMLEIDRKAYSDVLLKGLLQRTK